jgi:hypothetical protein
MAGKTAQVQVKESTNRVLPIRYSIARRNPDELARLDAFYSMPQRAFPQYAI